MPISEDPMSPTKLLRIIYRAIFWLHDEVGRGPLAGPVTTATFSIDYSKLLAAHRWGTKRLLASLYLKNIASDIGALAVINDSKKLKAKDRKALCNELIKATSSSFYK